MYITFTYMIIYNIQYYSSFLQFKWKLYMYMVD